MKSYIIGLLIVAGCKSYPIEVAPELSQDTAIQVSIPSTGSTSKSSIKQVSKQQDIVGVWAIETIEPLTIEINED